MKKTLTLSACLIACATGTFAQTDKTAKTTKESKYFLKAGFGYAFIMSGQASNFNGGITNSAVNSIPASFTAGLNATVSGGVFFNKHVGAELNLNVGVLNRQYEFEELTTLGSTSNSAVMQKYVTQAQSPTFAIPSLLLQSGGNTVNIYMRMGPALPLQTNFILDVSRPEFATSSGTYAAFRGRQEFKTGFRLGAAGAAGISCNIGGNVSFWAEASMLSFSPYVTKGEITQFDLNGVSYLKAMSVNDRNTVYEFSYNTPTSTHASQPRVAQTFALPYSNFGISAGLMIHL